MAKGNSSRFRLLPYQALAKRWRGPSLLMIPAGAALLWASPQLAASGIRSVTLSLTVLVVGALIFVYTLVASRAHISCHDNRFVVHTPLYPVTFSYQRITIIRSVEFGTLFPAGKAQSPKWRLYRDLWGKTAATIELKGFPMPCWWLKLWLHPYLFHPTETGLVVPVDDWMRFIRQMETLRTTWRQQRY